MSDKQINKWGKEQNVVRFYRRWNYLCRDVRLIVIDIMPFRRAVLAHIRGERNVVWCLNCIWQ